MHDARDDLISNNAIYYGIRRKSEVKCIDSRTVGKSILFEQVRTAYIYSNVYARWYKEIQRKQSTLSFDKTSSRVIPNKAIVVCVGVCRF